MRIDSIIWLEQIIEKLATKPGVEVYEVEEVLLNRPKIRYVRRGHRDGEDVYSALGRTYAGRHLLVIFITKRSGEALILSARNMARKERRLYEKS